MAAALVTGSGGLVGSEAVGRLSAEGYAVLGIENDMRAAFFGPEASTAPMSRTLAKRHPEFQPLDIDVRDEAAVTAAFKRHASELELVIHAAAQPSHDWAASDPRTDFTVNAAGTLNLLEATRTHAPEATFVFVSTNKVYGDRPNGLPLEDNGSRLELPKEHSFWAGIDTTMPIDRSLHSLFGVSKAAADLMVQEYGRYFGMRTVCFRAGCISGPNHAGARLHGFLSFLMRSTVAGQPYRIYGYGGKQVRDNIHSADLVDAFLAFHRSPRCGAVYNIGGGRESNCSMLEAIELCERIAGKELVWELTEDARRGDHRWWISDLDEFRADYSDWRIKHGIEEILREIHDLNRDRWRAGSPA